MQSHYKINVAKLAVIDTYTNRPLYRHLFATDGGLVNEAFAAIVFREIKERFPAPEYNVTITYMRATGDRLNWE